jgi:hypothetical protein
VLSLDKDGDTLRLQPLLRRVRDLTGHAFLDLQAPGIQLDKAGNFGKTDDTVAWHICHMRDAAEWQHVMLAKRVERNITHGIAVTADLVECRTEDIAWLFPVPGEEFPVRSCNTRRGVVKAFPFVVVACPCEKDSDRILSVVHNLKMCVLPGCHLDLIHFHISLRPLLREELPVGSTGESEILLIQWRLAP